MLKDLGGLWKFLQVCESSWNFLVEVFIGSQGSLMFLKDLGGSFKFLDVLGGSASYLELFQGS